MDFKKVPRKANAFRSRRWRLASVMEVQDNLEEIKRQGILCSWDIVRLLDGWVDGPGYGYRCERGYKTGIKEMLLVAASERSDAEMYSGVLLSAEGREAALLLSCEDKLLEVIIFVLTSMDGERQAELDRLMEILRTKFRNGRTVMHYAADQHDIEGYALYIAEILVQKFENGRELVKARDKYGRTALHLAAFHGNIKLCKFLMCFLEMRAHEEDQNGENLIHFAAKGTKSSIDIFKDLCGLPGVEEVINSQDARGKTALHKAAAKGSRRMTEALLSKVSVHEKQEFISHADLFGGTALHEATRGGHEVVVEILLKHGSSPLFERQSDGKTALHYAVRLSDEKAKAMAELLLNNCQSNEEKSLLLWASATGIGIAEEASPKSSQVKKYLQDERERTTENSVDLLSSAIELGHEKMAWELVTRCANTTRTAQIAKCTHSCEKQQRAKNLIDQLHKIEKMPERGRDQPAIYDSLGRKEFAEGLAALFLNPYVKSPLTVGISGDWGMGKSSLMIQTEIILLKKAAQLAFPNLLETEQFPGCRQIEQTPKGRRKYEEINKLFKNLLPFSTSKDDALLEFLDGDYQEKYHEVYKSLALIDRSEMCETKHEDEDEAAVSGSNNYPLGKIPTILTVRYNAWHYQNESEAWSGLAVEITKVIEESMTTAQRVRCHCRYAWRKQRNKIWLELFLPCLFALFLSGWIAWVLWKLISRSRNNELVQLTYGSIPITILVVVWTVMRQFLSVIKPISAQIIGYFSVPDHTTKLGYQHQVIFDINFLKEEIGEKPSRIWKFIGWLCNLLHLYPDDSVTVEGTSISKSPPPGKDDIRMIVFVDDLDRCEDTVILKVFSAINLVLAACNINVILGMDEKMISRAMKSRYRDGKDPEELKDLAKKYISKIVQLPLALPDTSEDETKKFLHEQLGQAFEASRPRDTESKVSEQASTEESACDNESLAGQSRDHVCLDVPHNDSEKRRNFLSKHSQILNTFEMFKNCLLRGPEETKEKLRKRKLETMSLNFQRIMPNYSYEELKALDDLSKEATGARKLPREWNRFLTYHRLAWNILSQSEQVKWMPGWQMQLVVWVFCCWQWEDQINLIIQNWKKLVIVNSFSEDSEIWLELNNPSLKNIVEHCYQKIWLPLHQKEDSDEEEQNKQSDRKKEKDEEQKQQKDKEKKKDEELELELEKEKEKKEREHWNSLKKTLDKYTYDVSMECIQSFQKFRLHCGTGYLSPPNNNVNRKEDWPYLSEEE